MTLCVGQNCRLPRTTSSGTTCIPGARRRSPRCRPRNIWCPVPRGQGPGNPPDKRPTLIHEARMTWHLLTVECQITPLRAGKRALPDNEAYSRRTQVTALPPEICKPSATPSMIRTGHLPLVLAWGSRRDQDHPVRSNEAQSPAGAAQPAHSPSRVPGSIPQREHSAQARLVATARTAGSGCPRPAGQSSSAAYRTADRIRTARRLRLASDRQLMSNSLRSGSRMTIP